MPGRSSLLNFDFLAKIRRRSSISWLSAGAQQTDDASPETFELAPMTTTSLMMLLFRRIPPTKEEVWKVPFQLEITSRSCSDGLLMFVNA